MPSGEPLSAHLALWQGICTYMPFLPGQAKTFDRHHLSAVEEAFVWITGSGRPTDGIIFAGRAKWICSLVRLAGTAWVFDLAPGAGLRGELGQATLWIGFAEFKEALHFIQLRYPRGGSWDGHEDDMVVATLLSWEALPQLCEVHAIRVMEVPLVGHSV